MTIYIPYFENRKWQIAKLESLKCNLYHHKGGGYSILAYNNTVAYNGDNVFRNDLGAISYQCKNYGNANTYKLDVDEIEWKNRKVVK